MPGGKQARKGGQEKEVQIIEDDEGGLETAAKDKEMSKETKGKNINYKVQ